MWMTLDNVCVTTYRPQATTVKNLHSNTTRFWTEQDKSKTRLHKTRLPMPTTSGLKYQRAVIRMRWYKWKGVIIKPVNSVYYYWCVLWLTHLWLVYILWVSGTDLRKSMPILEIAAGMHKRGHPLCPFSLPSTELRDSIHPGSNHDRSKRRALWWS